MTKNRSRNPHTKKGGRTVTTTKSSPKPTKKRAAPAKQNKSKAPAKSAPVAKKAVTKKSKPAAKPAVKAIPELTTAQRVIDALENLKGKDIVTIDVRKLTDIT